MLPDRWLYAQIFHDAGPGGAATDVLVREHVEPTARALLAEGAVDRFFFLRYAEGGNHLRYRVRLADPARAPAVAARLEAELARVEVATRLAWATYEPETEKHGGALGQELAERLFFASSQLACAAIARAPGGASGRALVAACALRELFAAAGFSGVELRARLGDYAAYWHRLACSWIGQHAPLEPGPVAVSAVRGLMGGPLSGLASLAGDEARRWSAETSAGAAALRALAGAGELEAPLVRVVFNLAHTFHNRLGLGIVEEPFVAALVSRALVDEAARGDDDGEVPRALP
ncbi:uncharacterized protein SOCE26_092120 [Sorangium cellulosum]|uniref:Thiopeptide-type bacteriocin biosynthesis domain-containing protein n=1 Tax=Sorangium cellulosum TaxID=56 RepID=A0A2L0F7W9_SORCE|nr:thiopeptide-type bacteriocin biosynthesis protein [Sorangium cellulosum]AUX47688.1 uncharacterized protein SOCE26_092120 [Sorangium cellulosum]